MRPWFLVFLLVSHGVTAAPPPGPLDPVLRDWFQKQYSITSRFCCTEADGHILDDQDWRSVGSGYEIRVNGIWIKVPPDAIRDSTKGGPNPTGHAVAWYLIAQDGRVNIICFAQGFEG